MSNDELRARKAELDKDFAEIKKLNLKLDMSRGKPGADQLDLSMDMLKTVIRNFISNAIKFSNENSTIDISVKIEAPMARISVRDHGVGISADRIATLFSDGKTTYGTANEEGSGLGLQLCKDFAVKNGGDVEVTSIEGEGSTFSVLVPLKQ